MASLELCSVPCEVGDVEDVVKSWHHIGSEIWPSLTNISQFERVFQNKTLEQHYLYPNWIGIGLSEIWALINHKLRLSETNSCNIHY